MLAAPTLLNELPADIRMRATIQIIKSKVTVQYNTITLFYFPKKGILSKFTWPRFKNLHFKKYKI